MSQKYAYKGFEAGATIKDAGKDIEVLFASGKVYDLPEDNSYVKTLVAKGFLTPLKDNKKLQQERGGEN